VPGRRSHLAAMLLGKCPRCRDGQMFKYSAVNLLHFSDMNAECPCCGIRLQPEPGFYQGAMYVSYGFTVMIIGLISAILYYLAGHPSESVYISSVIAVIVLLAPFNYRYSRILYLYLFGGIKYDPRQSG
jgi:uncharacterized protein (DUF983 family)